MNTEKPSYWAEALLISVLIPLITVVFVSYLAVLKPLTEQETPQKEVSTWNNKELQCLAETIWREARGEGYWGQIAVAQVVVNRVNSKLFPDHICGVVFQKGQFQWTHTWGGIWKADKISYDVALEVLNGTHSLKNFPALFFHANWVNPRWNRKKLTTIGNHIFYL